MCEPERYSFGLDLVNKSHALTFFNYDDHSLPEAAVKERDRFLWVMR
jgi:hypothetical protein